MLDKMKGGLIGLALGDAMGVATEFMTPEQIQKEYGRVTKILGGGVFGFQRGETSDDTAMTVAVAKGIITNSADPIEEIGKQFLKWRATNPPDIGITISNTFWNYQGDWFQAAKETHEQLGQSGGNGTLMRCLPIAFAYSNLEKIEAITRLQSKMTHLEDSAADACVIYNRIAFRLLNGEALKSSIETEINGTMYDLDYSEEPDCPPSGYVVHTLKWVFYWLLKCKTFEEVIIEATNRGNDSDTIAAIAGGLKGLEVGFRELPYKHVYRLLDERMLQDLAVILYLIRDKDTTTLLEHADYLEEIDRMTREMWELAERGERLVQLENLAETIYSYKATLHDEVTDFDKKNQKWQNVKVRFRRLERLVDLGAPTVIVANELRWLRIEVEHLVQIHDGLEPTYTAEEQEELDSLAETEEIMEEETKRQVEEME
ncbi:ADP-ribosylglycohydrolase family protein [Pseudoneobacillus sp. C159]